MSETAWKKPGGVMRLPHSETDERKRYTMADPDELDAAYSRVRSEVFPFHRAASTPTVTVDRNDLARLLFAVDCYLHLTTYELGQEQCVRQLRDIWRARRAATDLPEDPAND